MGLEDAKNKKMLYHLTRIDNIESIMENGLLPRKTVVERSMSFKDVADAEIIDKRTRLGLDAYIPFHFHPYSAFDVAVKHNHDASQMLYICIDRTFARKNGFKVLPMHPLSINEYTLYDYDKGFEMIDWDTLMETGRVDTYAREVKMAECLTDKTIDPNDFSCIYVPSYEMQQNVEDCMRRYNIVFPPPYVNTCPVFFNINK